MKLLELQQYYHVQQNYHTHITTWISNAKRNTIQTIEDILIDEAHRDSNWFINKRGSRIRQLVDEIFTLKLREVSRNSWSEADFEGREHSDLITNAINTLTQHANSTYHNIRKQIISKQVKKYEKENTVS